MKKPVRSRSGVVVITLLTKPYACPGQCIFCPTSSLMPKSYLEEEPAAQRAKLLKFDPFLQTFLRLFTLYKNGHNVNKAEVIIDGGTWSYYPSDYRESFIKGIFIALNLFTPKIAKSLSEYSVADLKFKLKDIDLFTKLFGKTLDQFYEMSLSSLQQVNTNAYARCVGLSVEERPDYITLGNLAELRDKGVTKVQVGIQSMNDGILTVNKRGHTVEQNIMSANLLRLNGFKINAHFMPNLLGATPKSDLTSYRRFIKHIAPDEIKIYPTILFKDTPLFNYYAIGTYKQYTQEELIDLIINFKKITPRWVRINRIFRDVPASYMQGIKINSNLREIVQKRLVDMDLRCNCIRCRQIRPNVKFNLEDIKFRTTRYLSSSGVNLFMEAILPDNYTLLGFVRLFLPYKEYFKYMLKPIRGHALIREVHVYGNVLNWNQKNLSKSAQHIGIGKSLLERAERLAKKYRYSNISVISAIGTKVYYQKRGFKDAELNYMTKEL